MNDEELLEIINSMLKEHSIIWEKYSQKLPKHRLGRVLLCWVTQEYILESIPDYLEEGKSLARKAVEEGINAALKIHDEQVREIIDSITSPD